MALVPFKPAAGALVELRGGADGASIPAMVAAQQELLHAQVDQLHRLVVAQCRLTGVNPLSQEMAAGALSIKIGKKPRDLLNPKAVKYMQSLFAVKDTIGKKETREISALCGVTVTQVREFFASQRSRVRKLVRLSREKAMRIEASLACDNVSSVSTEQTPIDIEAHAEVVEPLRTLEPVEVPQSSSQPEVLQNSLQPVVVQQTSLQPVVVQQTSLQPLVVQQNSATSATPTGTVHPTDVKTIPDAVQKENMQVEVVPGVESEDKQFLDSIFALMRKEETFSGQVKLMEWILQINNLVVLSWFLTMGGLTIVSTWLSQAASEEQTSVILIIFKVLLHLPLHKALPVHMSAVLQTINRLRFYRTPGISNRARNLLSRLSKVLVRSQALKKPQISSSKDTQKEFICKQSISEILRDESWKSEVQLPEEILALTEVASESRKPEPRKARLLLTSSADESNKKSSLQTKSKERRKVLLVEHPNRKAAGKNVLVSKSISTNNSRPLSADDIQKAKMRAMFMQEKYGKVDSSKATDKPQRMENKKPSGLFNPNVLPASRSPLMSTTKRTVDPSPSTSKQSIVPLPQKPEILASSKPNITSREHLIEKLDSKRVCWQTPPEVWLDPSWSVGAGDNSKEREVQTQRNRREKETFYASLKDIPQNPKDPWDVEMDFDDSLTPEIPIDQPPDNDTMEVDNMATAPPNTGTPLEDKQVGATSSASPAVAAGVRGASVEPDLELLAVLLKNPEVVFALTSNQGRTLPNEQTVALLDILKQTGLGLADLVSCLPNGGGTPKGPELEPDSIPASLPSPTPPSDPAARASWRSEFPTPVRVPNLQQPYISNREATPPASTIQQSFSGAVGSVPSQPYASVSALPAQMQTTAPSLPQLAVTITPPTQQHIAPVNTFLNRAPIHQHAQSYPSVPDTFVSSIHQQPAANKPAHDLQHISNRAQAHLSMSELNAAYTTSSWQSSAANVTTTGQNTTPDRWATRTTNSSDVASSNSLTYPNQNAYSSQIQSTQNTCNAYGSASVLPHTVLPVQGSERNGYAHTTGYQMRGRDDYYHHSRSPELVAGRDYNGTQSYILEPSRQWNSGHQTYSPETTRQWNFRKQDYYNANDGRLSSDREWDNDRQRRR